MGYFHGCRHGKRYQILHLKYVQFAVCQLYYNKAVFKKVKKYRGQRDILSCTMSVQSAKVTLWKTLKVQRSRSSTEQGRKRLGEVIYTVKDT